MTVFEELFLKSKGQPIDYNGRLVQMMDELPVGHRQKLRVTFESVNSDWRQGIALMTDGFFKFNGQRISNSIAIWQDTAPRVVELQVESKDRKCRVKNIWDVGDGVVHSWHNGAAMIVERDASRNRYLCNDGRADDDFDDLILELELLPEL